LLIARKNKRAKTIWYAYATSISLTLLTLAGAYNLWFSDSLIEVVASESVVAHLMPDSSMVWIKPGSALSYHESFGEKNRKLDLDGAGFFEVKKNKALPFTITSSKSTVEVLGTSFLFETTNDPRVQVFTGIVKFQNNSSALYETLQKGQNAVIKDGNTFEFESFDPNSVSWKTGKLIFEDEPLKHVLKVVSQFYDTQLAVDDPQNVNITATFDKLSLEEVVDLLKGASDQEITIRKK
jgi:ferric-dicitrate binding protein FerR (iron transport regulator)